MCVCDDVKDNDHKVNLSQKMIDIKKVYFKDNGFISNIMVICYIYLKDNIIYLNYNDY